MTENAGSSVIEAVPPDKDAPPPYKTLMGHPQPLWMLFMTEFWERFAFYGARWALVLYVVAQFKAGDPSGQRDASHLYGAYLALVYAAAIFGGWAADKLIGYQRAILSGAVMMAVGLFMLASESELIFKLGLAVIVVGNGLFKPIISTLVGKIYAQSDSRRDSGFTIFYMGINLGAMISPVITQVLAEKYYGTPDAPAYKVVFIVSAIGMVISFFWFLIGRATLQGVGKPDAAQVSKLRLFYVVAASLLVGVPLYYFLLSVEASTLNKILMVCLIVPAIMLIVEGVRGGKTQRDRVIALLIILIFNIFFWCFFEQAGSSFNFLAEEIVERNLGFMTFPAAWFQSINSVAIIIFAPIIAWVWVKMGKANPSIPRKFGLGLMFNGLAFLLLVFALSKLVSPATGHIPFWTLFAVYWIQSIGELCLSPIGLSMTTKLAPARTAGFAMGVWFLSIAIGNNLAGLFAGEVSGEGGMTTQSASAAYTQGFWILMISGVVLLVIAPLVNKLMHGVK